MQKSCRIQRLHDPNFSAFLAMLIVINKETANNEAMENHQNEYVQLLNKCCNEVQIFKNYVNSHPEFDEAKTGGISLWEAATLLPFNYS